MNAPTASPFGEAVLFVRSSSRLVRALIGLGCNLPEDVLYP
jgi:hypothetical protein